VEEEGTLVVIITAPDQAQGEKIARTLIGERLAACVNLIPGVKSFYWWQGKMCEEGEFLLLVKTRSGLLEKLTERVKAIHPYEVPEIIALPIIQGLSEYLDWVRRETGEGG